MLVLRLQFCSLSQTFIFSDKGRDMVDFLHHGLSFHLAREFNYKDDDADIKVRIERAFLMTDIHARKIGVMSSGSTVALCLIKVQRLFSLDLISESLQRARCCLL
jgi:hypothetical protein